LFVPGYRDDRQAAAGPGDDALRPGSPYGWAGSASGKGPVRGFPPAPGQPPPLYPPGQFSAWNRSSVAEAEIPAGDRWADEPWPPAHTEAEHAEAGYTEAGYTEAGYAEAGYAEAGYAEAGYAEPGVAAATPAGGDYSDSGFNPGYSALAVSDPAADVTSTQTWGAVGDGRETGAWTDLRTHGDDQQSSGGSTATQRPQDHSTPTQRPQDGRTAADSVSGQAPQPGRSRGHGTGAHSARTGPRGRLGSRPQARRKLSRGLLAAGIAVLVVLAGGIYVVLHGSHGGQPAATSDAKSALQHPSSSPSASSPTPTPTPTAPWGHIESRTADPVPLTLGEVFPATFAADVSYSRTVSRTGTNCAKAVVGGKLQHAVLRPGCSQVLRGSYLSVSKKLMGTIGVLNLTTFKAAERAGKAAGPAEFIEQLAAAKGPTRNLTKGTGIEEALIKGHYLILVWAEFTTLHKPKTKKQRSELEAFLSLLIQKTANVSLTSRMVTGKP